MNNLFEVSLLTPEEVEGTVDVNLPENKETPEAKKEIKDDGKKEEVKDLINPKAEISLLTPEEVDVEIEETETGDKVVKQKNTPDKSEVALDLKALAESRIKSGAWEEYENWEELKDSVEWTPELFEKLETEQFENRVSKAIEEEKASYGGQAKLLLDHLKNGGKVEDLLPSIQQEIDVENLDEDDPDAAEELVRAECEAKGWSDKRTKAYINSLKDQGEDFLKETAKEAKSSLKSIIEEERVALIKEQEKRAADARAYWENFNKKTRESIFKDEELSGKEQKDLEKFAFDFKYTNEQTGQKYSDFNKKFEEIKSDPSKYAKLIKIVKNFDEVVKKDTAKKEALKETTFLLRGAQEKLSKNKTTESPEFKKSTASKGQWNPFQIKN